MSVYRLLMPARDTEWSEALLQGLFYSSINFAILFPVVHLFLHAPYSWWSTWIILLVFIFLGPSLWPYLLVRFFRSDWVAQNINIPYPSTWDYFFDQNEDAFLLIHLNNGDVIGGLWAEDSFAGQHPNHGDLYLEALYRIDDDGTFGDPIPYTKGMLIKNGEYSHIEIFEAPSEGIDDAQE